MVSLVENEIKKMFFKKRLHVIFAILVILIGLFAYGENYTLKRTQDEVAKQLGIENIEDWRSIIKQQITDLERRLDNPYIPEEGKASIRVRLEQLAFYLEQDISPLNASSAKFMGRFVEQSLFLFLPLLIILLASDMVSGEVSTGTIKVLLTQNTPRWKILMSKQLALLVLEALVIVMMALISLGISFLIYGYTGFEEPFITGFKIVNDVLDTSSVKTIPQWEYLLMAYAIAYFIAIVMGSLSLMISVFVKSTSSSIGIMMSTLIGGSFLSFFIKDWALTRYLYTVNLNLLSYITGSIQSLDGLTMVFSVSVLCGWILVSQGLSYWVFIKKDMLA